MAGAVQRQQVMPGRAERGRRGQRIELFAALDPVHAQRTGLAEQRFAQIGRGKTLVFAGVDEAEFFNIGESGSGQRYAVSDAEIIRAVLPRIVDGGLTSVLSQTFRSIIHSRLVLGMKQYERLYPETDIILIEPDHRDPELYLANTFSYAQRHHLAEHAYQQTRVMLRSQKTGLSAKLARHGISLNWQF